MFKHKIFVIIILSLFHFLSNVSFSGIKIIVKPGWNLISIPYDSSYKVAENFPTAISKAYNYDNRYMICDTIVGGLGYWLKFPAVDSISIDGGGNIYDTVKVNAGWNMIGSVHKIIPKHLITTHPEGIILSHYYKYNPSVGYEIADTVKPGEGYWVKCSSPGTIIFTLRPKLISPTNNSSNQPRAISFKWQSLIYANFYHIQVAADSMFNYLILEDSVLSDTYRSLCNLEYASNYYWRVRGYSDNVWGKWSDLWKFHTCIQPEPLSNDLSLFTFTSQPAGLKLINPNTFEAVDSISIPNYLSMMVLPITPIEFSPGDSIWYTILGFGNPDYDSLYAVDAFSNQILKSRERPAGYHFVMDKDKQYIIHTKTSGGIDFVDRQTFSLIHTDTIKMQKLRASPTVNKLYGFSSYEPFTDIIVYNIDSFKVEKIITIDTSWYSLYRMRDLNISPDGRYIFISVWTSGRPCCYQGTFYTYDLENDSLVAKYPCGRNAQIEVSPDGRFAYISDPWPYTDDYWGIREILRYNVSSREMETFIKWGRDFPGVTKVIDTKQIIISPDSRFIFIHARRGGELCNGRQVNLIKIDVESKDIVSATYLYEILGMKFGKYMK
ncbi:MAG: hypothetical protein Q8K98_09265 [Bacteroidota bacterium]|nr:hypothetical protein [Bacteroidota bacterium]